MPIEIDSISPPEDQEGRDLEAAELEDIDLEKLAEEIFRLLKHELWIENERQGR